MSPAAAIFAGPSGWRLARAAARGDATTDDAASADDALPADATPATIAEAFAARCRGDAVLCVDSPWCLAAVIPTGDLPRRERRRAMVYRLEERFPLAAEDVAADFVEAGDTALGIAALVAPLTATIAALEARGVEIVAICPTALLAAAGLDRAADGLVAWRHARGVDLLRVVAGRPAAWQALPAADAAALARHAGAIVGDTPTVTPMHATTVGLTDADYAAMAAVPTIARPDRRDGPSREAAAVRFLRSGRPLPVDLRRDALAPPDAMRRLRRPLAFAAAGLVALLIAVCAAGTIWAHRLGAQASAAQARQEAIFRELYPRAALPASITSRLASESRRLTGTSGTSVSPDLATSRGAACRLLLDVLGAVPPGLRVHVNEMHFDADGATLTGTARTREDVEALAAAIRAPRHSEGTRPGGDAGLEVDPPRAEQRADKSVAFTLAARPRTAVTTKGAR